MTATIHYLHPFEREDLSVTEVELARKEALERYGSYPKSGAPSCTRQSRRAFATNRLCGWKKPMHGNAFRRPK